MGQWGFALARPLANDRWGPICSWEQLVRATNSVVGASLPDDRSSDICVHILWTYPM
uniref:Uncharacterized protein n=1 Tax=Triticum urartu TaxID=4572 RepID=A0A8R7QKY2_TRIUA